MMYNDFTYGGEYGEPEDYGYVHEEDLPDYENIKDHFIGLVEILYGRGDLSKLERPIEEIARELEVELPSTPLMVRRQTAELDERSKKLFDMQVAYTRAYANFMSNQPKGVIA